MLSSSKPAGASRRPAWIAAARGPWSRLDPTVFWPLPLSSSHGVHPSLLSLGRACTHRPTPTPTPTPPSNGETCTRAISLGGASGPLQGTSRPRHLLGAILVAEVCRKVVARLVPVCSRCCPPALLCRVLLVLRVGWLRLKQLTGGVFFVKNQHREPRDSHL